MSDLSTYLGNKFVRWIGGQTMPSAPTTTYLALFNGDPKSGGSEIGSSVNSSNPRQAISWDVPASGTTATMESDADCDFGNSENGSLSLSHVAIYDASTSGNLLATKQLSGGPYSIETGVQVIFESGALDLAIGD